MTKIKNSKKGMAKKTLSISLAVAMLATSNVPVWAAEFTDGSEAVFTSEAESPVEVVEETTVAEEVEAPEAQLANDNDVNTDARLVGVSVSENGWASYVGVKGEIKDHTLTAPLKNVEYRWVVASGSSYHDLDDNGVIYNGNLSEVKKFYPGEENLGKELYLHLTKLDADDSRDNLDVYVPAGTVSKQNINNLNVDDLKNMIQLEEDNGAYGNWDPILSSYVYSYNGKERFPKVLGAMVRFEVPELVNETLTKEDFDFEYTHSKGNFIDADSECEVVATPKNKALYEGILTQKYRITQRQYQEGDVIASLVDGKKYEYTGKPVEIAKSDVVLKETIRDNRILDSEKVIETIIPNLNEFGVKKYFAAVHLLDIPNYFVNSDQMPNDDKDIALGMEYEVIARDLTNCTVEIDGIELKGNRFGTLSDERLANSVHVYDAEGKELNLKFGTENDPKADYMVIAPTEIPTANGTYDVIIKAGKSGNTYGTINAKMPVTTFDFNGYDFYKNGTKVAFGDVDYTGETAVQDFSGLKFGYTDKNGVFKPLGTEDYKVTVTGVDAGANKGSVIVEGLRSYEGAKKVFKFNIRAAKVVNVFDSLATTTTHDDIKVQSKVVFDRGNTNASDYAPKVTVKAHNKAAAPWKEFDLVEGKDYVVKYNFDRHNEIGDTITTTVTIINPNFQGTGKTIEKIFTEKTLIARKQLSDCTIEVKDTYTYTGAGIIPEVVVMDGDEILTKDVDYTVSASNNINVGKDAVVTVKGTGDYGMNDADGIYDKDSTLSTKFEITPANASDVEVVFAGGNTGIRYTGKNLKPTVVRVNLNGNDVTQQFNVSYPQTNINVGTGMVTLTPVKDNKNFIGTKDATFAILPRELKGALTIYDKDGHKIIAKDGKLPVSFDYDGTEHTFAEAVFVPDKNDPYSAYVTENDFEVKYVDNVYGGTAHIYVLGKGNFFGNSSISTAEDGVIKSVVTGTDYTYSIATYQFKEQHVTIGDAEYAAGQTAKPQVKVTVLGKELVEGTDYVLTYGNRGQLTNGKTEKVTVTGIKAFRGTVEGYYAVVKRDLAHTNVVVTEKSNGT